MHNDHSDARTSTKSATSAPSRKRYEPETTGERELATLKWYNPDKKFGFVVSKDRGDDVFLHISAIEHSGLDVSLLERGVELYIWRGIGRNGKESVVKVELTKSS